MLYRILAELTVVIHFCFVLFVVAGGLFVLRWPKLAWAHLPAAIWGTLIEFAGWICPLTPLEVMFRRGAGEAGYSGSFIEHYITDIIYPNGLERWHQFVLGGIVLAINLYVYGRLFMRLRRRRSGTVQTVAPLER